MEWEQLLSNERLEKEDSDFYKKDSFETTDFESDYKKIIISSSFRRLQDKTQVFPLDKSDFVRTRLTHSIETSYLAKQLGMMIGDNLCNYQDKRRREGASVNYELPRDSMRNIGDILMCAGALHDIGNPPFGHFGEVVIRDWFKNNLKKLSYKNQPLVGDKTHSGVIDDKLVKDLCNFEGNAQALRLLTRNWTAGNLEGMNLTAAVLNTLVKYPVSADKIDGDAEDIKYHKLGFYQSETEIVERIAFMTGTRVEEGEYVRHPLTYILEAADDIAYATADLEDAFKKGLFTLNMFIEFYDEKLKDITEQFLKKRGVAAVTKPKEKADQLIQELKDMIKALKEKAEDSQQGSHMAIFRRWLDSSRYWLLNTAAFGFTSNYKSIMEGTYKNDLFIGTYHEMSIEILKAAMGRFAYRSEGILKLELAAQTIIDSLMDRFIPAVIYYDVEAEGFKQSKADKKLTDLLPDQFKESYKRHKTEDEGFNVYLRLLMVSDYISGMTDSFAKNLYQELNGIY